LLSGRQKPQISLFGLPRFVASPIGSLQRKLAGSILKKHTVAI